MKKRIAIINQRYGLEVNGGSELHARVLAERLSAIYEVEVLTTCALEYTTWENHYSEGIEYINYIKVHRFPVDSPRTQKEFDSVSQRLFDEEYGNRIVEEEWVDKQGPLSTKCIDYIKKSYDNYDAFIFVTYLYYLTVRGIPEVADKAILVPTAHDEPYVKFGVYKHVFKQPQAIVFNTEEEQIFIHNLFHNANIPWDIVGVGIDSPQNLNPRRFTEKYGSYIIYVGRIDEGKNCHKLFQFFIEYKKRNNNNLKLLLMGKAVCEIPNHQDIIPLGFVSDEDKQDGMAGAEILVLPSEFESLSLVVLESMISGVPVVVNGKCEVLRGHCVKSNAGLYYKDYLEFEGAINYLLANRDIYEVMSKNACRYVEENYQWPVILDKLKCLIDNVIDAKND